MGASVGTYLVDFVVAGKAVALADAAGGAVDVAIMDVNLARGSNGVETAGLLRQRWDIPSLFVSGNLDEGTRSRAMQWRPVGFIGKPYSERGDSHGHRRPRKLRAF
ncbi:response regulator [Rhizobium leguminosarum bv. viciae]|nr:response regulator [Rhizobium leguminosarum bv. viciae]NKK87406.1 response regulator [Rhizobium leguminosarum bv. viciae]